MSAWLGCIFTPGKQTSINNLEKEKFPYRFLNCYWLGRTYNESPGKYQHELIKPILVILLDASCVRRLKNFRPALIPLHESSSISALTGADGNPLMPSKVNKDYSMMFIA
jgi:hypothetical protein